MPDFRIVDTAEQHPKLRAAGLAAAGLWSMAGAKAMKDLTDGWVPEHWVIGWPSGKRHAATLVRVGLWTAEDQQGVPGYRFHDWRQVQRSVAQIETERARTRNAKANERASRGSSRPPSRPRPPDVAPDVTRDIRRDSRPDTSVTPNGSHNGVAAGVRRESRGAPYPQHPEGVAGEGSSGSERATTATIPHPEHLDDQHERQPCGRRHDPATPCGACGQARRAQADADAQRAATDRAAERVRRECRMCDGDGRLLEVGRFVPVSPGAPCDHVTDHRQQVADARDEAS